MTTHEPQPGSPQRGIEVLATFAHELRSRLQVIAYATRGLAQSAAVPTALMSVPTAALIDRQVRQIARLVEDLLDAGRCATGKISVCKARTDVATIVDAAVETCYPALLAAGHELVLELPPQPLHVHADPLRRAQVVANLLDNASKYSEVPGRIELTVTRIGDNVVLRVHDDGIGIPAELLPRIFDLFFQADRPAQARLCGLGIGLSLAKTIVELHAGSIEASSGGPGCGSLFTVRLPVAIDESAG
jgi:signal transduction histidine kinase